MVKKVIINWQCFTERIPQAFWIPVQGRYILREREKVLVQQRAIRICHWGILYKGVLLFYNAWFWHYNFWHYILVSRVATAVWRWALLRRPLKSKKEKKGSLLRLRYGSVLLAIRLRSSLKMYLFCAGVWKSQKYFVKYYFLNHPRMAIKILCE